MKTLENSSTKIPEHNRPKSYKTPFDARGIVDRGSALVLLVILLPVVVWRALLARLRYGRYVDQISRVSPSGHEITIFAFAGVEAARDLALLFNIINGDVAWTGAPLHSASSHVLQKYPNDTRRPGIINPGAQRKKMGVASTSTEPPKTDESLPTSLRHLLQFAVVRVLAPSAISAVPESFRFVGVDVHNHTMESALQSISDCVRNRSRARFAFINPDCLNKAAKNLAYRSALNSMDKVFADGSGLQLAARHLGIRLRANVNGTDLFPLLCDQCAEKNHSIYLYGAGPGIAERCATNMKTAYPALRVVGTSNGYSENNQQLIDTINASGADILLVALGAPKQELWITNNIECLDVGVAIGVGGLFDFYSGRISRSPVWLRELGMEWIWRFLQEPSRMWRRYLVGNPLFVWRVWHQRKTVSGNRVVKRFSSIKAQRQNARRHALRGVVLRSRMIAARVFQRMLDVVSAGLALLALSPLLIAVAVAIRLESPGSIVFTQQRVGKWGILFNMYKFRSMCTDAEAIKSTLTEQNEMKNGVIFKMKSDPRITRIGRFIRKYSIDELPQLFNVLKGDMSLVGPRPALPTEVAQYTAEDRRRLDIKPGITCLWQVSGRSEIPFDQQVEMDVDYIDSHGLATDLSILLKTIPAVFAGKGAY